MTEKEKMLSGELYKGEESEEILKELLVARELCMAYNTTQSADEEKRKEIIKKLFGKTANRFHIEKSFNCDYGYNIEIGEDFFANFNLTIIDGNKVKFGDKTMIGPNCLFSTISHPIDPEQRRKGFVYAKPIEVGNNVWIGANVVVLGGVKIGDNSVIGAGSVVTRDIPANVVAYGSPCKVAREIV